MSYRNQTETITTMNSVFQAQGLIQFGLSEVEKRCAIVIIYRGVCH